MAPACARHFAAKMRSVIKIGRCRRCIKNRAFLALLAAPVVEHEDKDKNNFRKKIISDHDAVGEVPSVEAELNTI
jgi:hypothetical protein